MRWLAGFMESCRPCGGGGKLMPLFQIRLRHREALERAAEEQFVRDVALTIRREDHAVVWRIHDRQFHRMVGSGIQRARRHGLAMNTAITMFVKLMFEVAPNFDEHPEIRAALSQGGGTPEDRFYSLRDRIPDAVWGEASKAYRSEAWAVSDSEAGLP